MSSDNYLRSGLAPVYKVAMAKKNPAAVSTSDVSRVMAALGHKGGTATAENRTPEERAKSAKAAAKARWDKARKAQRKPAAAVSPKAH
jgi:hypothetical protein